MKKEVLYLSIRGEKYKIHSNGDIERTDMVFSPSEEWKFLGVSTHWRNNHIVHSFEDIWDKPELALKGYVWDLDHGTTRMWGGQYNGKLPRVEYCVKRREE